MAEIGIVGTGASADLLAERLGAAGHEPRSLADPDGSLGRCATVFELGADRGPEAKRAALAELLQHTAAEAQVVTAVEATSVTALAADLGGADSLVGIHHVRRAGGDGAFELVAVAAAATGPRDAVADLLAAAGLVALRVADRPGLLLDTLHLPFLNQAAQALDEGLAAAGDLDLAVESGLGHAVGPLRALREWGLGEYTRRARDLCAETGERWQAPPALLELLVTRGDDSALGERGATR